MPQTIVCSTHFFQNPIDDNVTFKKTYKESAANTTTQIFWQYVISIAWLDALFKQTNNTANIYITNIEINSHINENKLIAVV